jgi:hypothetical protein
MFFERGENKGKGKGRGLLNNCIKKVMDHILYDN